MNRVAAEHPERRMHVILDNPNAHNPKRDRWRARHENAHFHFISTHASWFNQVEVWFSIHSSHALAGASFTSPRQVRAFIAAYNQEPHPFAWTKQVVFSKHPRSTPTFRRSAAITPCPDAAREATPRTRSTAGGTRGTGDRAQPRAGARPGHGEHDRGSRSLTARDCATRNSS